MRITNLAIFIIKIFILFLYTIVTICTKLTVELCLGPYIIALGPHSPLITSTVEKLDDY